VKCALRASEMLLSQREGVAFHATDYIKTARRKFGENAVATP